jgi:hypothetical protein
MNRVRAFILAIGVGIGAGGALGTLFPARISRATNTYVVDVYPGGNGYLTCGWHSTCLSPCSTGAALDFGDPTWVYFRSLGWAVAGAAGQGRIAYSNPNSCGHLTYVDIYDAIGNYRTEILYEHVSSGYAGYSFTTAGHRWRAYPEHDGLPRRVYL